MSTTDAGRKAEDLVAGKLQELGHHIIEQNWRSRWCEIDVVSTHKNCVYFTEVKFRSSSSWGSGLEYVTDKKLRQMNFAAEFWMSQNGWTGDACLQAAEVDAGGEITIVEI